MKEGEETEGREVRKREREGKLRREMGRREGRERREKGRGDGKEREGEKGRKKERGKYKVRYKCCH